MRPKDRKDKIAVVVGTVTNDVRILDIPKLKVSVAWNYVRVVFNMLTPHYVCLVALLIKGNMDCVIINFINGVVEPLVSSVTISIVRRR